MDRFERWSVSRKFEKFIFDYSLINIPILVPFFPPRSFKSKKKKKIRIQSPLGQKELYLSIFLIQIFFFFLSFSFVINTAWNFERGASLVSLIFSSNRLSKRTRLPPFTESRATLPDSNYTDENSHLLFPDKFAETLVSIFKIAVCPFRSKLLAAYFTWNERYIYIQLGRYLPNQHLINVSSRCRFV